MTQTLGTNQYESDLENLSINMNRTLGTNQYESDLENLSINQ